MKQMSNDIINILLDLHEKPLVAKVTISRESHVNIIN